MRGVFFGLLLTRALLGVTFDDLVEERVAPEALEGRRVSIEGQLELSTCPEESESCTIVISRRLPWATAIITLHIHPEHGWFVRRKRVGDPVQAGCFYQSLFEYQQCVF